MRGNLCEHSLGPNGKRSIPACAGEPSSGRSLFMRSKVYPRVCGGTGSIGVGMILLKGLSPRVRGNLRQSDHPAAQPGSIPACAGEPRWAGRPALPPAVYPRVCGGTEAEAKADESAEGLSPRVRGNRESEPLAFGNFRSIPACAGEPSSRSDISCRLNGSIPACAGEPRHANTPCRISTVYPRVCGGTTCAVRKTTTFFRSIPACAGEPY